MIIFFHEPLNNRPTLDFACAEVKNHFSKVKGSGKINLMSITEQEDFHKGQYGFRVTLKVLRTKDDAVFFAGPCTGGSPWNRLNSARGEETSKKIENKKKTFWKLFSAFEEVLFQHQLCGALMELPSGCSYWKDPRLISFMDGTPCRRFHIHGCMYGVVEQHGGGRAIKKPWSFVSWNRGNPKGLEMKCDGSHDHVPCAGQETKGAEIYTPTLCRRLMEYCVEGATKCDTTKSIHDVLPFLNHHHWSFVQQTNGSSVCKALCAISVKPSLPLCAVRPRMMA